MSWDVLTGWCVAKVFVVEAVKVVDIGRCAVELSRRVQNLLRWPERWRRWRFSGRRRRRRHRRRSGREAGEVWRRNQWRQRSSTVRLETRNILVSLGKQQQMFVLVKTISCFELITWTLLILLQKYYGSDGNLVQLNGPSNSIVRQSPSQAELKKAQGWDNSSNKRHG